MTGTASLLCRAICCVSSAVAAVAATSPSLGRSTGTFRVSRADDWGLGRRPGRPSLVVRERLPTIRREGARVKAKPQDIVVRAGRRPLDVAIRAWMARGQVGSVRGLARGSLWRSGGSVLMAGGRVAILEQAIGLVPPIHRRTGRPTRCCLMDGARA